MPKSQREIEGRRKEIQAIANAIIELLRTREVPPIEGFAALATVLGVAMGGYVKKKEGSGEIFVKILNILMISYETERY